MPMSDMAWRPDVAPRTTDDREIADGAAYIEKIFAVEGKGGNSDTYRAACKLQESGLSESAALWALLAWNKTNAEPPWSERDLLRIIESVYSETV